MCQKTKLQIECLFSFSGSSYTHQYSPPPRFMKEASRNPEPRVDSPEQYRRPNNRYFDEESDYDSEDEHYNE